MKKVPLFPTSSKSTAIWRAGVWTLVTQSCIIAVATGSSSGTGRGIGWGLFIVLQRPLLVNITGWRFPGWTTCLHGSEAWEDSLLGLGGWKEAIGSIQNRGRPLISSSEPTEILSSIIRIKLAKCPATKQEKHSVSNSYSNLPLKHYVNAQM